MAIYNVINGTRVIIPGVYSSFAVAAAGANVVPSPRNILIFGEADEGKNFREENIRDNFFTDPEKVKDKYKSGPIVDAAYNLFSRQTSDEFTGQVGRVYVLQTNNILTAKRVLEGDFGTITSSRFGDIGNAIKVKINETEEVLPSHEFSFVPNFGSFGIEVSVNGKLLPNPVSIDHSTPATLLDSLITELAGLATVEGGQKNVVSEADELSLTLEEGNRVLLNSTAGFDLVEIGDTVVIPMGSVLAGAGSENVGSYIVEGKIEGDLELKKLKSFDAFSEVDFIEPVTIAGAVVTATPDSDLVCFSKIKITVIESTDGGSSLEISSSDGSNDGTDTIIEYNPISPLTDVSLTVCSAEMSVDLSGVAEVKISDATWNIKPEIGDLVEINPESVLSGASDENVGFWVVHSAGPNNLKMVRSNDDLSAVSVAKVKALKNEVLLVNKTKVSTELTSKVISSIQQRAISIEAVNTRDNSSFRSSSIGGNVVFGVSYNSGAADTASVSIDNLRKMTLSVDGMSDVVIPLNKYINLKSLRDYINSLPNFKCVVPKRYLSYSPDILDEVQDLSMLSAVLNGSGFNAQIKSDFSDFVSVFENNQMLDLELGNKLYKFGLPDADDNFEFLIGGAKGATSNQDIIDALNSGVKAPVRMVNSLFSRDARFDIDDGLTESESEYTIEAINLAVAGHVGLASNVKNRKERIGQISIHADWETTKDHIKDLSDFRVQLSFQDVKAINSEGNLVWSLPHIFGCMVSAGRAQSLLGTSALRKKYRITDVRHIGDASLFSSELTPLQFNHTDSDQLEIAMEYGLLTIGEPEGQGLAVVSPDSTTLSEINDPKAWFYERANIVFLADEVLSTVRQQIESVIGKRTSDITNASVSRLAEKTLESFIKNGSIREFEIKAVIDNGDYYTVRYGFKPTETLRLVETQANIYRTNV